jgi:hypothetical protein
VSETNKLFTRKPNEAVQFRRKPEAIAAAKSIGWLSKDATRIEVMGFQLWTVGDDHGQFLTRQGYEDLCKQMETGYGA